MSMSTPVMKLFDLSGQVALVTGGSRGLGLQIAETLVELGARVALVARKADELDAAVAHLAATYGADAVPLACDLADVRAVAPVVERAIAALGPIDILVNNAGTTWGAATVEHPLEAWQKVVNLNLTATFLVTQEVGKRCMVPRRRGKVINIASVLGLVGGGDKGRPATLAYNTSTGVPTDAAPTTLVLSQVTGACSACHDSPAAVNHMTLNGGLFYAPRSTATGANAQPEQYLICHGPGRTAAIGIVHQR